MQIKLPGKSTWSVGICRGLVGPRSYEVQVGAACYRRNRRHLILTNEQVDDDPIIPEQATPENEDAEENVNHSEDQTESENVTPSTDNTQSTPKTRGNFSSEEVKSND